MNRMVSGHLHQLAPKGTLLTALAVGFGLTAVLHYAAHNVAPFATHPRTLSAEWKAATAQYLQSVVRCLSD